MDVERGVAEVADVQRGRGDASFGLFSVPPRTTSIDFVSTSRSPRLVLGMPSRKGKLVAATPPRAQPLPEVTSEPTYFPFARYTSVVGVHTSLLAFTALLLPATTPSLGGVLARWDFTRGTEGRDIMQALTEDPLRTLAWICIGAVILQCWWAGWVKEWFVAARAQKVDHTETAQQKLDRNEWTSQRERAVVRPGSD